jgi:hypothetical protein
MRMNSLLSFVLLSGLSALAMTVASHALANQSNQPNQADSSCYWVTQSGQRIDLSKICDQKDVVMKKAADPLQVIQHAPGKRTPSPMWNLVPDAESPIAGKTYSPTTEDPQGKASAPQSGK